MILEILGSERQNEKLETEKAILAKLATK